MYREHTDKHLHRQTDRKRNYTLDEQQHSLSVWESVSVWQKSLPLEGSGYLLLLITELEQWNNDQFTSRAGKG